LAVVLRRKPLSYKGITAIRLWIFSKKKGFRSKELEVDGFDRSYCSIS